MDTSEQNYKNNEPENLNWMSEDDMKEHSIILKAEEEVYTQFILFYEAFRKADLLKRGKNPADKKDVKMFDDMMLSAEYDQFFLQRKDFYSYISENLFNFVYKST